MSDLPPSGSRTVYLSFAPEDAEVGRLTLKGESCFEAWLNVPVNNASLF